MNRKTCKRDGAFTIVELLVVITIISLLAAFVAPRMFRGLGKAKRDIARAKMATLEDALGRFNIDCGRFPTESEGLAALVEAPTDVGEKWRGPYLKKSDLLDPWNNDYIYVPEGQVNPGFFDLISLGADGQEGGEGDNADIYNE
jgi:general secretion pathway protein G